MVCLICEGEINYPTYKQTVKKCKGIVQVSAEEYSGFVQFDKKIGLFLVGIKQKRASWTEVGLNRPRVALLGHA